MTRKTTTLALALITGITGFLSWLSTVPPEMQSGWLATLVELTPVEYRPQVALATRFATLGMLVFTQYRATHSSPPAPKP